MVSARKAEPRPLKQGMKSMRLIPVLTAVGLLSGLAIGAVIWLVQSGAGPAGGRSASVALAPLNDWEELVPPGAFDWVPERVTDAMLADPSFMAKVEASDRATRPELAKTTFRLPGYMVPIDYQGTEVTRFLLVPNAGQCIHQPPPPINQTVLVEANPPVAMHDLFVPIDVTGELFVEEAKTDLASSGYRLQASRVQLYRVPGEEAYIDNVPKLSAEDMLRDPHEGDPAYDNTGDAAALPEQ